ncbi:MAG: helix-turn-helix domain-containing protein [Lentisphaerae bacterium]|nr:helix-turn-helix domain-containing protein [Lentisphaerota bacterium]
MTLTEELMQLALVAPDARKAEALRLLRGDVTPSVPVEPAPEKYLTLRELSRQTGLSTSSLWRWGVPGHELGGRRKFRVSEVEAYLRSDVFRRKAEDLKEQRREVATRK